MAEGGDQDLNKTFQTAMTECFDKMLQLRQSDSQHLAMLEQALMEKQSHGSQHLGVKLPTFHGKEKEDVNQFLLKFRQVADFHKWDVGQLTPALPVSLEGQASIWFNSLPASKKDSFHAIEHELKEKFNPAATQWRLRQTLGQRKQGTTERISDYAAEIRQQCSRLDLPKADWVHVFLNGLLPAIKDFCVLQQPKTFEEAENLAMLKESVLDSQPSSVQAILPQLKDMIVQEMKSSLAQPDKSLSSFNPPAPQMCRNSYADNAAPPPSDLEKLEKKLEALTNKVDNFQRGRPFNRSTRSRFGNARCFNCGIIGHTASTCNRRAARDPRIPNQNRQVRSNQHPSQNFQQRSYNGPNRNFQGN